VLPGHEEEHTNLMTTVDFYKTKIDEMKEQYDSEIFEDKRQFEIKS